MDNFDIVIKDIINNLSNLHYKGDVSDIGNEIGYIIGKLSDQDVIDFKRGLEHGIDLNN